MRRRRARETARTANEVVFTACGVPLESVPSHKYLGRTLSKVDSDWPCLHAQLAKGRRRWGRAATILARDGASPRVSGMFYKAIVMTVILYGCES